MERSDYVNISDLQFGGSKAHVTTLAPVIKAEPGTGHSGLVVSCPPHALPFGVIFEEYAARRRNELEQHASEVFHIDDKESALSELRRSLENRDKKYRDLAQRKTDPCTLPSIIDGL